MNNHVAEPFQSILNNACAGTKANKKPEKLEMREIELLRKIAGETKILWDKGGLPLEAIHLKNLLTDYIDFKENRLTKEQ